MRRRTAHLALALVLVALLLTSTGGVSGAAQVGPDEQPTVSEERPRLGNRLGVPILVLSLGGWAVAFSTVLYRARRRVDHQPTS